MTKLKKKISRSKPFFEDQYSSIPLRELVLYSVFSLQEQNVETNFENIVVESFELFPKKFSLQSYPEYPDTNRIRREIQRIEGSTFQAKGIDQYLVGNLKTTYKFTDKGMEQLSKLQDALNISTKDRIQVEKKLKDIRGKYGRVLNEIEKHPAYKKFLEEGENLEVSETLLRDILFATMETPNEKLRDTMNTLIGYSDALNRDDIKKFLKFLSIKFSTLFH
jgi:hypothetical protein